MNFSVFTTAPSPWAAVAQNLQRRAVVLGAHNLLLLGLLLFGAVWLLHLDHASLTPPADNIEQLTWVGSLEAGYHKHPPLPTWLLWLPAQLFGATARTSYAMGAATTLATMALLWHLLARLRGGRHATLAVLATLCITFYNGRLYYYNHNTVLMLAVAASAALGWRAVTTGRLRWWAALGVCIGLGALAKYQMVLAAAATVAFWLHQGGWRVAAQRRGLLTAGLLALATVSPHLLWLPAHDFGPIQYAMASSLGVRLDTAARLAGSLHWLVDQLFNRALPAWLLLAVAVTAVRRARRRRLLPPDATAPAGSPTTARHDAAVRALMLCWGVLPLGTMTLLGIATGAELQMHWGTAFLPFAVPAAMEIGRLRPLWRQVPLLPVVKAFAALQLALLLVSHLTSPHGPASLQSRHWRNFDSALLADSIGDTAREALGGRIRVVAGPGAEAGALSLRLAERPLVLIDGRAETSPWVAPELVERCGAVELSVEQPPREGFQPVGGRFPGLSWRVKPPRDVALGCPE